MVSLKIGKLLYTKNPVNKRGLILLFTYHQSRKLKNESGRDFKSSNVYFTIIIFLVSTKLLVTSL